ncbi:MAG: hypothetical protein NUV51_12220 [Sulfuricaulis sp.]|nr:hypothetical protein [Sulfuricaulis sp.]
MRKFTATAIAVTISLTFSAGAMAKTMSKNDYKAGMDGIAAEYKSDKTNCKSLSGNANDVCMAEATGKEKVAKANLEARNKNTNQARYEALVTKAEADYSIAKERCDDLAGNVKDVCLKEAKAAETAAKADAKSQMKISKANKKANEESADARQDATMDKRDADYTVAKEKCDVLAGGAKDSCMNQAKMHHGKM